MKEFHNNSLEAKKDKIEESIEKLIDVSNNLKKIKKLQLLRVREKEEKWQT